MRTAFCFDLDGTITREELLPRLARELGIYEEIRILTEATLKGDIPFKRSFELRCRLLADIPISRVREIVDSVEMHPAIVSFIRANQTSCFVVTGNLDVWIEPLVAKLGCRAFTSRAEFMGDQLSKVAAVLDKSVAVHMVRKEFNRVVAVGDGMNDASMFEVADIGVAYGGVHDPVPALVDASHFVVTNGRALCRLLSML